MLSSRAVLDAMGKLPAGLTLGGSRWLGNYDQCRNVQAYTDVKAQPRFSGKYCTSILSVKPVSAACWFWFRLGVLGVVCVD